MFQEVGRPITQSCLAGYNGTVFAYGQTGSGKTHTILGMCGPCGTACRVRVHRGDLCAGWPCPYTVQICLCFAVR